MVTRLHLPAWLATFCLSDLSPGMLLIVGLFTPVAASLTAIDMAMAILDSSWHGGWMGPISFALPLCSLPSP